MQLKSFKEYLSMGKEAIEAALVPVRAAKAKAIAQRLVAELDEKIITKESSISEMVTRSDIDFDSLINRLDEVALLNRRKQQFQEVQAQLFPEAAK